MKTELDWQQIATRFERMRSHLSDISGAEVDLRAVVTALEHESPEANRWAEVLSRLRYSFDEVKSAIAAGEDEFQRLLVSSSLSPVSRNISRFLLQRTRQALSALESTWDEIDNLLIGQLVDEELSKPRLEDYWWSQWRDDAAIAKDESLKLLSQSRQPKDAWMLRLKYERGLTQQQIADLVNVAQSTVATRLARLEEQLAEAVAVNKVTSILASEGFHAVHLPSATGFDIMAEGPANSRVAVQVEIAGADEARPRSGSGRDTLFSLRRLAHLTTKTGPGDKISKSVVAVYFRGDCSVGFFPATTLLALAESVPDFSIAKLRSERVPYWSLMSLIHVEGGDDASRNL